jgi:Raf kinase inhibitor-like YbhB/YbcL family protein
MPLTLTSTAFVHGGAIPTSHTCQGAETSPPLAWSGIPDGTRSLALIVDDPDAPDPASPRRVWVHWVLWDLPPDGDGLAEGAASDALPRGTHVGRNDSNEFGYGGPCPPVGCHRYFHTLYALDAVLGTLREPTKASLLAAMDGHVLATAELMGTYQMAR